MPTENPTTETATPDVPPVAAPPVEPDVPQGEPADTPLGPNGEKALAAEREARKAAERRLAELEAAEKTRREAEMSELEKAQAKAAEEREARLAAEHKAASAVVSKETGVPEELLVGDSEDAMRAYAQTLQAWKGKAHTVPTTDGQGPAGLPVSAGTPQLTRDDLKAMTPEQRVAALEAGQLATLLGAK